MHCAYWKKIFPFPTNKPSAKPNLHGWLGGENQLLLQKFANKEIQLIFEFGTWLGKSTTYMPQLQSIHPEFTKSVCVDTREGDWSIKQTDKYTNCYNPILTETIVQRTI